MTTHRAGKPAGIPARDLIVPAAKRRHPAGRALILAAATAAVVAAGTGVASATGAVANSCAVVAPVVTTQVAPDGLYVHWLTCGHGQGNVTYATVKDHPFFVKVPGQGPVCFQAGQRYYPNNPGNAQTAVLTPTVRCTSSSGPGSRGI